MFKSGNRENPNNYRGITLSNCLGKRFHKSLHNHLESKLDKNNIISKAQIRFWKYHRTMTICILFSLIKKYVNCGKYPQICFVDFKKVLEEP